MFVALENVGKCPPKLRRSDMFVDNLTSKHVAPTELFGEKSGGVSLFYKHATPTELNLIAQVERL